MSAFSCILCHAESDAFAARCAACGKHSTLRRVETPATPFRPGDREGNPAEAMPAETEPSPMRARTESLSRASTGLSSLDLALGGGLVSKSAVLLAGEQGAGKSTLGLWMLAAFQGSSLLVGTEETREQVEERATRTLPKTLGCPLVCTRSIDTVLRHARDGRRLVLIDSLHLLDGKVEVNAKRLLDFTKSNAVTLVCIAQLTKDGRTVRGGGVIAYLFDAELRLEREYPDNLGNPIRRIEVRKNRYGAEGVWRLALGPTGWTDAPPEAAEGATAADIDRNAAPTNLRVLKPRPGDGPGRA